MQHPRFRKSCIFIAQKLHTWDIKLRMSLLGQTETKVRPLNDRKAIEDGATFLAESFVFGVAGSIILYEAYKTRKKQNERTEMIEDDIKVLQDEIEYIKRKMNDLGVKLDDYMAPKELRPKVLKTVTSKEEEDTPKSIKIKQKNSLINEIETLEKKYKDIKK